MTRIYFVRHAQSDHKKGDDRTRPLTPEGRKDAGKVLEFLRDKQIDSFYCSPYIRSVDTIRAAAEFFGLPIRTDERLREREAGPGGNSIELFRKRWADFDWHEPGGETLRSTQERNIAALTEILAANRDKPVAVGTHGTALSTILNYYEPGYDCDAFLRMIDWMPFVVELDFDGTNFLSKQEHVYVEKIYRP